MKHLLSAAGEQALLAMFDADPLLAFDFDGTLAPIVILPEQVRVPAGVCREFQQLCAAVRVAVLTGRSVRDITPRLPAAPRHIVGNHGAEGLPGREGELAGHREICERWLRQIVDELQLERIDAGILVEHKTYSISLHYRLARDRERAAREIEAALPQLSPAPHVIGGKCCINLLPPGAPTKRLALERLLALQESGAAFYVGDDETDEIVFRQAPPNWVTCRVGHDRHSAARFFLYHQNEMTECLQLINGLLKKSQARQLVSMR